MKLLLLSLLGVTVVSGIIVGGGGYGSSSSSEEYGGGHGHHHPRPPNRPPPRPRPPPARPPPPAAPRCNAGWLQFDRPQGRWCVQVVHANINNYQAQERCAAMGGTLSGIQNDAERIAIANEGRRVLQPLNLEIGSIWLGARRKTLCPRSDSCTPDNTFAWTDGITNGTEGFRFSVGQPDGSLSGPTAQDCLQQIIYPVADTSTGFPGMIHGTYDDQWCIATRDPVNRFFACGKRAV